ncbi:MAG TPA: hypothetical protein EYP25_04045 [Anaerolineae bacterium]|nr:hypothetical protein [Caldilineae bacterium]HID33736.1 hypothetical protein [Anaerolineae bacterium]
MLDAVILTGLTLGAIVLGLLFIMALLSPLEALTWWAGWTSHAPSPGKLSEEVREEIEAQADRRREVGARPRFYLVYLTAIGGVSAEELSYRERVFLETLTEALPEAVIISDVYPFSVTNNPLTGERMLGWLWRKIHEKRKTITGGILATFIFARNLFNVAVSADPRYGPINNAGVAREIAKSLYRHDYPLAGDIPVVIMGWSGGGQIAVGVAPFLCLGLDAPIYVVSIGGVLTDDPGIAFVEHLWHLQGDKDHFHLISDILFPGRWPFIKNSAWNRFKRAGKMTVITPGPMSHTGKGDYFDSNAILPNGQTFVERTVEIIRDAVRTIQPPPPTSIEEELEELLGRGA